MVAGGGIMLFWFSHLFPLPMVNETVAEGMTELLQSSFRQNVEGHDPLHWARGDIKVYQDDSGQYLIEFQSNFEVGPGPNLWLYINTDKNIDEERDFKADKQRRRITKVKSYQGSQVYKLSPEQIKDAKALTIWCESFGQYIGSANLDGLPF